jgi:hypothetical protein
MLGRELAHWHVCALALALLMHSKCCNFRPTGPFGISLRARCIMARTVWLDRATIQFRFFGPSSFNTALQLVLRPHFSVRFV